MTSSTGDAVQTGFWHNWGSNPLSDGPRILVPGWASFVIVSLLAVWIALWSPGYFQLTKRCGARLESCCLDIKRRIGLRDQHGAIPVELQPIYNSLLTSRVAEEAFMQLLKPPLRRVYNIISRSRGIKEVFIQLLELPLLLNLKVASITLLALAFCGGFFTAVAAASTVVAFLVLDNYALSRSAQCGAWVPDVNSSINITNPMNNIMDRVDSYYKDCYENEPSLQDCGLFAYTDLHVNIETKGVECPFEGDVCSLGQNSTIMSLDTGLIDSKFLGINSRKRPFFRRRSICAPLVTDGYYNATFDNETDFTSINFYYGPANGTSGNATYSQTRSPKYEQLFSPSGYQIKTRSEMLKQFQPIEPLLSKMGYVFLAFVDTFNLEYPSPSYDPIFSATAPSTCSDSTQTCWKNSLQRASVLGCTELAQVCSSSKGDDCIDVWAPNAFTDLLSKNWSTAEEAFLIIFGLNYSDFGDTLSTRHGFLLDATRRIDGNRLSQSLSVNPEQWQLEVRRLFEMSLLRVKMEMLAIVRGTRYGPGYMDVLPGQYRGACRKFKFQAGGYNNLSFVGVLMVIFVPILVGLEIRENILLVWFLVGIWKLGKLSWIWYLPASQIGAINVSCMERILDLATLIEPGQFRLEAPAINSFGGLSVTNFHGAIKDWLKDKGRTYDIENYNRYEKDHKDWDEKTGVQEIQHQLDGHPETGCLCGPQPEEPKESDYFCGEPSARSLSEVLTSVIGETHVDGLPPAKEREDNGLGLEESSEEEEEDSSEDNGEEDATSKDADDDKTAPKED